MVETKFNVGMTWYVFFRALVGVSFGTAGLCLVIGSAIVKRENLPKSTRDTLHLSICFWLNVSINFFQQSDGCAGAVKRILGKIDGAL